MLKGESPAFGRKSCFFFCLRDGFTRMRGKSLPTGGDSKHAGALQFSVNMGR